MRRAAISRRYVGLVVAVTAGVGIGAGSLTACSNPAQPATTPAAATAPVTAGAATAAPTTVSTAPTSTALAGSPITATQASAIAVRTSPGTVTEVDQDVEATGPVFDVTVQHADGSETKVEVDATNGHVLSTETDGQDGQPDQPDQPDAGN